MRKPRSQSGTLSQTKKWTVLKKQHPSLTFRSLHTRMCTCRHTHTHTCHLHKLICGQQQEQMSIEFPRHHCLIISYFHCKFRVISSQDPQVNHNCKDSYCKQGHPHRLQTDKTLGRTYELNAPKPATCQPHNMGTIGKQAPGLTAISLCSIQQGLGKPRRNHCS